MHTSDHADGHMPITVNSIGGMHKAFTETGENRSIQRQLITPATPVSNTVWSGVPKVVLPALSEPLDSDDDYAF